MDKSFIRHSIIERIGLIDLNRPSALNSLNLDMVNAITDIVTEFNKDPYIRVIYISSASDSFFCAGGDIKSLYLEGIKEGNGTVSLDPEKFDLRRNFFRKEYHLDYILGQIEKPVFIFVRGVCFGGGIGISAHNKFTVISSHSKLAMPETAIGFFPDCGTSYYLSRAPYNLGMFYALTGFPFTSPDAELMKFNVYPTNLIEKVYFDYLEVNSHYSGFNKNLLEKYLLDGRRIYFDYSIMDNLRQEIENVFGLDTLEGILVMARYLARKEISDDYTPWTDIYKKLIQASPISLKVTFKYLKMAKNLSVEECFKMDYRISQNFMRHPDFYEGVRAAVVDKTRDPKWRNKNIDEIKNDEIEKFFILNENDTDLELK